MAKYCIDYTVSYRVTDVERGIIEADSLASAKRLLKEGLKAEYEADFLKVKFNSAYHTSDDARVD